MTRRLVFALVLGACAAEPSAGRDDEPAPMAVGEDRELVLRYLELNVQGFSETLTLADLREIPRPILDDIWLMDLELTGFVDNSLAQIQATLPENITDQAARNLARLINMSPNNVRLQGTSMEALVDVSRSIGIAPQDAVADLMQSPDPNASVIATDIAAAILLENLIGTHPRAQTRFAPDGTELPVGRHSIPIRLGDVVDNFARMHETFGPTPLPDGRTHPGIIKEASGFAVVDDQFSMTVLVNANALPYKGVDLDLGSVASVNSLGSQIDHVFPIERPDWLVVKGMVGEPYIGHVTVEIRESPQFFPPGNDREPQPYGNSTVWSADPWLIERMVADMAFIKAQRMESECVRYNVASGAEVFKACMDETGWVEFETFNNVGDPPTPRYMWDIMNEMAQVRLHDEGLPEGTANAQLTLTNLSLGVRAEDLTNLIRQNVAANPAALRELAEATNQNTRGEADFYYYRPEGKDEDWLFFVDEKDIPRGDDGARLRPYAYAHPGFWADAALTQPLSSAAPLDGDETHHKLKVAPGMVFYTEDTSGAVFELRVGDKPAQRRLRLSVKRLR